jgi:hypothetical protein
MHKKDSTRVDELRHKLAAVERQRKTAEERARSLSAEANRLRDTVHAEEMRALLGQPAAVKMRVSGTTFGATAGTMLDARRAVFGLARGPCPGRRGAGDHAPVSMIGAGLD